MKLLTALKKYWPILVLLGVEIFLFLTNYIPDTFLMGWDNVLPEFNFALNFKRELFAVWQDYRGLGHPDGMSHAANLVHTAVLWLLSFALPLNLLRYTFHFLMHFAGAAGMYFLLNFLFKKSKSPLLPITYHLSLLALVGALFYQLNFITIQMFYTPLEAFSMHFAALPWFALTLSCFVETGKKRHLLLYLLVLVFFTPQYFVTTLIFASGIVLGVLGLFYAFKDKTYRKRVVISVISFVCVNAFWLLPYAVNAFQNAPIITGAKINQMSSEEIFLRNKQFGDIKNILFLRGFSLDFVDLGPEGVSELMMQSWREHLYPLFPALVMLLISLITVGAVITVGKNFFYRIRYRGIHVSQWNHLYPYAAIFLIGFIMLGNNIPGIGWVTSILRDRVPFFGEAFRFPFTKFSLLFGFSYTIFFTVAIFWIFEKLRQKSQILGYASVSVVIFTIFYLAKPAFSGDFFYANLRVKFPTEYLELFDYMQMQPTTARVAYLPAFEYWSWKFYRWGYRGSGFLWHGIPQPLLDRAFDPWSRNNENFYWELNHALYSKDTEQLTRVFKKYAVDYVIHDEYLLSSSHNRAVFNAEISELLRGTSALATAQFGDLTVYQINAKTSPITTVSKDIPAVYRAASVTNDDRAYQKLGTYSVSAKLADADVVFPFRSLSTQRAVSEREFNVIEDAETFLIQSKSVNDPKGNPIQTGVYNKKQQEAFDSSVLNTLTHLNPAQCDNYNNGKTESFLMEEAQKKWRRFSATNSRLCTSFNLGNLVHTQGYLVAVESRNVTGKPLKLGIINKTAKHTEIETDLPSDEGWKTSYFILPPLADDGLSYDLYITDYSIGEAAINDIASIRVYRFPYEELLNFNMYLKNESTISSAQTVESTVKKINPILYVVTTGVQDSEMVMLSQAYDSGWKAFVKTSTFPYFKGLTNHVLVNNWANGWKIQDNCNLQPNTCNLTIYIFYWPQILQWLGFGVFILPFLFLIRNKYKA